jgi:hypothetical protein
MAPLSYHCREGLMLVTAVNRTQADNRMHFATTPFVIAISLFTFAVCYLRLFVFPNVPIVVWGDQLGFLTDGSRMLAGELLYRDFFEMLPPGIPLTYALLVKWFGLQAWIPNLLMACLAAVTVLLMTVIAGRLWRGASIVLPGLLFAVIALGSLDATHHWFSTVAIMAATLVLFDGTTFRRSAAAGVLCGLAGSFTPTKGATAVAAFVAYLVWKSRRESTPASGCWRKCLLLCGTAAAVFAFANAYFMWTAGLSRWIFCVIVYPLRYYPVPDLNNWRVITQEFQWHMGMARWAHTAFLYVTVPLAYIIFFFLSRHRRWKTNGSQPWDQLLLVALTGISMFVAIAPSPSLKRLSTVSPPAMILLAWLLNQLGKAMNRVQAILGTAAFAVAIAVPIRTQAHWRAYLELPAGRSALQDPALYEEYSWVLEHTHPGQFFWGMAPLYPPFHLQNPAAIDGFDPSEYTRPEQIDALVQALEKRRLPLLMLHQSTIDLLRPTGSPSDHLQPFRVYLCHNYRLTRTFATKDDVWERKDLSVDGSDCRSLIAASAR